MHLGGAFMLDDLQDVWQSIHPDTDILVTHTPAYGYQDVVVHRQRHVGCPHLRRKIEAIIPKVSICGHIHESYGYSWSEDEATLFINASTNNQRYRPIQPPIVFDL
ncbi:Metallophosphoesterase mpped2 [Apophysomyces sp. BC1015]|nr:Metallophosphoesterase mpped2 [Apophysomyces sp. BC1015]